MQPRNTDDFVKSLSSSLKDQLTSPSKNDSIDNLTPSLVLNPRSIEDISECLSKASEYGLKICPIGGGTRLNIGNPPEKYDIALSLTNLNKIVRYKPSDLSITVQAGLTLGKIQSELGQNNQFLPISAPLGKDSTLGGILAVGTSGPLTWLNGNMRDAVTGMKTVYSDGVISKSGGQVMKNVSGYEMSKLHIGGLGTLGIISEVSLKVTPKPINETSLIATFAGQVEAFEASMSIFHSKINTLSLSYINPGAVHKLNIKSIKAGHLIAIRLYGRDMSLQRCINEVDTILKQYKPKNIDKMDGQDQIDIWRKIDDFGYTSDTKPYISMRISLPPTIVGEVLGSLESTTVTKGLMPALLTQIGHGTILFHIFDISKNIDQNKFGEIISDTRRLVRQRRGTTVIEQAPVIIKQEFGVWDGFDQIEGTFRNLKSNFDSSNTLNTGRFIPSKSS